MITFNKPYLAGNELKYITEAINNLKISGDGVFTRKCHQFFEEKYGFKKVFLTHSCTAALEMAALLIDTKPGDEIIVPSFTFVSTANAFALRGAKLIFADSSSTHPNIDVEKIEKLITSKTKAIVVVHYGGVACDMDILQELVKKYKLYLIEDAAHAIDSFYKGKPLGSFGDFAAFSFHETKNISSGEGGMLVIKDEKFIKRAEYLWDKGTNRADFFRGNTKRYEWVDIGSSFLPSDMLAAFLFAQLEQLEKIQLKRISVWNKYDALLSPLSKAGIIRQVDIPRYASNNAHLFYILCKSEMERDKLLYKLNSAGIQALSHYFPLHQSLYAQKNKLKNKLPQSEIFGSCIVRFPLYYELSEEEVEGISNCVKEFYNFEKI